MKRHQSNPEPKLLKVAKDRRIAFTVVRLWLCDSEQEARQLERQLKGRKNGRKL
ncbi:hypothetical protein [Oscillatoria sp. CS-180]|uniref:hypothetical protein n=1 Tax=Oscillatoria sp. CS-180 TaxID=3021720 RepID=UPI003FA746FF